MTREEAIECAKNMTYQEAVRNTFYAKGVRYKKATRIKLHELAEIADKLVLCKDCIHYESDGGAFMVCRIDDMVVDDTDYCSYGERKAK